MKKIILGSIIIQLLIIVIIFGITKLALVDSKVVTQDTAIIIKKSVSSKITSAEEAQVIAKPIESKTTAKNNISQSPENQPELVNYETTNVINFNNGVEKIQDKETKSTVKQQVNKNLGSKIVTIINNDGSTQEIKLLDIELDDDLRQDLANRAKNIAQNQTEQNNEVLDPADLKEITSGRTLFIANDLGMSNVPVLNQGPHGTCVTFATTALLNAKMKAGDFISQQCILELGVHINNTSKSQGVSEYSGWNGLFNDVALERIKQYGVISKSTCPHDYANTSYSLTYQMYLDLSSRLWADSFDFKKLDKGDLAAVKTAINNNNRVAVGVLLHKDFQAGIAVNGKPTGLWNIPYDVNRFVTELTKGNKLAGGHALVITGYDDEKQLLKVRNSWGENIGDSGEFYLTYDYFELMSMEVIEVF